VVQIELISPDYCKRDIVPQYALQILYGYLLGLNTNLTMANIMAETCSWYICTTSYSYSCVL